MVDFYILRNLGTWVKRVTLPRTNSSLSEIGEIRKHDYFTTALYLIHVETLLKSFKVP